MYIQPYECQYRLPVPRLRPDHAMEESIRGSSDRPRQLSHPAPPRRADQPTSRGSLARVGARRAALRSAAMRALLIAAAACSAAADFGRVTVQDSYQYCI
eukprot:SAG31_NODE_4805_length_2945_cov_16.344694_1_plen_99_part_10